METKCRWLQDDIWHTDIQHEYIYPTTVVGIKIWMDQRMYGCSNILLTWLGSNLYCLQFAWDTIFTLNNNTEGCEWGWSGGAKVLCILRHWASNWNWLTVGQGLLSLLQVRVAGECFYFLFLHFHSCSSFFPVPLFHLFYYLFYLFLPFSGRWHKMTHKGWHVIKPQHNQKRDVSKECRPRSDMAQCSIWPVSMFAINSAVFYSHQKVVTICILTDRLEQTV